MQLNLTEVERALLRLLALDLLAAAHGATTALRDELHQRGYTDTQIAAARPRRRRRKPRQQARRAG